MEAITPLNLIMFAVAFAGLLFGTFGRKERSYEKRISDQESQKEKIISDYEAQKDQRDQRSIRTLYTKHDELVTTVKALGEKLSDRYWTKDDVKDHLASNNETFKIILEAHGKTFQTKLDHVEKTVSEIKVMLTAVLKKERV